MYLWQLFFSFTLVFFTACSSGGSSGSSPTSSAQKYDLKFKINPDGEAISQLSRVTKALPKDFNLTTETLAEQNVTISLYISEITIDGNILRFDANLTKGFDEETDSHFFYLDKFIDGSDVDLKNPTKFEIAFEYADEKFYGEFISNGIVDSDGTLLKDTILFTVKRLNIENPPAVTVIEDFQLQNGFNKTIVDITFDNVFRTRSFENLDAVPDFRVEATNENAEILLLHFSMYSEDENAIVGKISDETDISYKSILLFLFVIFLLLKPKESVEIETLKKIEKSESLNIPEKSYFSPISNHNFEKEREVQKKSDFREIKRGRDLTRNSTIKFQVENRNRFFKMDKEREYRKKMVERMIKRIEDDEK
jgi:hypothetical protein